MRGRWMSPRGREYVSQMHETRHIESVVFICVHGSASVRRHLGFSFSDIRVAPSSARLDLVDLVAQQAAVPRR